MARIVRGSAEAERIDAALADWRQGDLALEERWFAHVADVQDALTEGSAQAGSGLQVITSEVEGLVVVTQTCDIVRSCVDRAFVEVAPLVEVSSSVLDEIQKGRRPAYAAVPAVAERRLVADLDRVMTVEKSVVAAWDRTPGCGSDSEARDFARSLARKRARFAFPDDFTQLAGKLQGRLRRKHDRDSEEGRALRALREIRVRATPSWDAAAVEVTFWFIREAGDVAFAGKRWDQHLDAWLKLVPAAGRFRVVHGLVVALEDLTARDYLDSDPLDLDHLSTRES